MDDYKIVLGLINTYVLIVLMVEAQLIDTIYTTITTIVLIGSMIFGAVKWQVSQAEKKSAKVKKEIEDATREVKEDLEVKIENVDKKVDALLKRRLRTRG